MKTIIKLEVYVSNKYLAEQILGEKLVGKSDENHWFQFEVTREQYEKMQINADKLGYNFSTLGIYKK